MSSEPRELAGAEYPPRLRDLPNPPASVYVVGELPRLPCVAIVGTRRPSAEARAFAVKLARQLAEAGIAVISGGASGIDTAAHLGALDGGGPTLVVAPSSYDCPYPGENAELFRRIVGEGGGFLSRYPRGTPARLSHFFERNSMLAALSQALVIVQTNPRGGARNAASAARRLGRPVLAVPGAPWQSKALGCLLEIRSGATVITSAADVLKAIGSPQTAKGETPARRTAVVATRRRRGHGRTGDPDRDVVVSAMESGARDADSLCVATGLPPARVQAMLLTLTLEGIVVSDPSGRVSLVNV